MEITVVLAGNGDREHISSHRRASEAEGRSYRGHLDPQPASEMRFAVVRLDGENVGSVGFVDTSATRELGHLYVVPECREVGAGDALLQWVIDDARNKGLSSVRASALPGDRATKNLFERHGLIARAIQVEKKLG